ncbi:Peptide hydrolase [Mycena sanguinolenta]|uniref:Peptide hydrolase n=1 Tax=Mycena sanguinolenta TaxID=230812 RepID=A0A8H7CU46_9AGAR|nr:Peptide hydrolase [Mycena sanguinolenta]
MPSTLRSSLRHGPHSRNPGRRDGYRWNSDAFICPASVDGFRRDPRDVSSAVLHEDEHRLTDLEISQIVESNTTVPLALPRHEVALMDIARYAKLKGVAKEFEVLEAPRRVIVLDEDAFVDVELEAEALADDDWEWEDFEDFDSRAGPSTTSVTQEMDDYFLARRLQDEEYARAGARPERRISGTGRRAYADVLVASNG